MSARDERELRARVDAADEHAAKCSQGHAICGNNVFRDSLGHTACYLCRIERARERERTPPPSRRKPRIPLNPGYVQQLRLAAGLSDDQGTGDGGLACRQ